MRKNITSALIASALAMTAMVSVSANAATERALERLCYVKAEDAPVAYHAEAKRFGISRQTLRKLETSFMCNGVPLGEVENNWVKRNPRKR